MKSLKAMKYVALFLVVYGAQAMASNTAVLNHKAMMMQKNAQKLLLKSRLTRQHHLRFDTRMLISAIRSFRAAVYQQPSRFTLRNRLRMIQFRMVHLRNTVVMRRNVLAKLIVRRDLRKLSANLSSLHGSVQRYARAGGAYRFYGYHHTW